MNNAVSKLLSSLEAELDALCQDEHDPLHTAKTSIQLIQKKIEELKTQMSSYKFRTIEEEVDYCKNICPGFYSEHYYLLKVYDLEIHKANLSRENFRKLIEQEFKSIDIFFFKNAGFCQLYYKGSALLDEMIFTRRNGNQLSMEDVAPLPDDAITIASHKVALILANQKYRSYLEKAVQLLDTPMAVVNPAIALRNYRLKASKADIAELCEAIVEEEVVEIDGRPLTLKDAAQLMKSIFSVDLGNIYEKTRRNKMRKKEDTPFLNRLVASLKEKKAT